MRAQYATMQGYVSGVAGSLGLRTPRFWTRLVTIAPWINNLHSYNTLSVNTVQTLSKLLESRINIDIYSNWSLFYKLQSLCSYKWMKKINDTPIKIFYISYIEYFYWGIIDFFHSIKFWLGSFYQAKLHLW